MAGLAVAMAACGGPAPVEVARPSPARSPDSKAPVVQVRFGRSSVRAEVAATAATRQVGLMFRKSISESSGMLFVFAAPHQGGFWMKNTLIPLTIAFMSAADGSYRVAAILDMEPCATPECPVYDPKVPYVAALEVNRGWFAKAGVKVGDLAAVEGRLPSPEP